MLFDTKKVEALIEALKKNPEKKQEIFRTHKILHAVFEEGEGIPPRFASNFREESPNWEKVTGLDFEAIGRILVCHLCIEHYLNNLIELSTPKMFDWDNSKMSFSQKLRLVGKVDILSKNKFNKGIEIVNNIRNKLSHNMLATIDEKKVEQLKNILLEYRCKGKNAEEKECIMADFDWFGPHAIIESFTQIVCAIIAGFCSSLNNKPSNVDLYYKHVRSAEYLKKNGA